MTFLDWVFIVIVAVSMVAGLFRGLIKEAISLGSLLLALWAAFQFAPAGQDFVSGWIESPALQVWIARAVIFTLFLMLGALAGWAISTFANQVGLSGLDRMLGLVFGFARASIIAGLIVIAGPFLSLDQENWWTQSRLLPLATRVAEVITIMAPQAYDYVRDEVLDGGNDDAQPDGSAKLLISQSAVTGKAT